MYIPNTIMSHLLIIRVYKKASDRFGRSLNLFMRNLYYSSIFMFWQLSILT